MQVGLAVLCVPLTGLQEQQVLLRGVARTDVTKDSEGIPPIAQPKVAKNDLGTGRHDFHNPEKGCDPPGLRNALSSTASMLDENPPAPVLDPPLRPEAGIS